MNKKVHANAKRIIVRTEDEKIYKEFDAVGDCAEFFNKTKAVIYNRCATPDRFFLEFGVNVRFESASIKVKPEGEVQKIDKRLKYDNVNEVKLRATETEDQTRRRLGLNPYGEWRNDEWIQAMMDRVDKMLYPDGYDAHAAWLSMKGKERIKEGKVKARGDISREDLDEEFEQYIK